MFGMGDIRKVLKSEFTYASDRAVVLAFSVGAGLFIGMSPLWGWHTLLAIAAAVIFRLNRVITVTSSLVSIPPLIPFIIYAGYVIGGIILGQSWKQPFSSEISVAFIKNNILQYLVGSLILGAVTAVAGGLITYAIIMMRRQRKSRHQKNKPTFVRSQLLPGSEL